MQVVLDPSRTTRAVRTATAFALFLSPFVAACGSWQRVGTEERPTPTTSEQLPQVFDPSRAFREMGLLVDNGPLGFVGTARVIAGPRPDSLLLIVGLSMHNRGFTFRHEGEEYLAEYRVETTLRPVAGGAPVTAGRDQRIRVGSFRETQRVDESVIFQDFIPVTPGSYQLTVSVRDRNSPNGGRAETTVSVPALRPSAVSLPIAVYRARPRERLDQPPELVINPRQSVEYGTDTLFYYVETYGASRGSRFVLAAVDANSRTVWSDTTVADSGAVHGVVIGVPPAQVSIGRYELRLLQNDTVMAATPFLVTFSDQYAVANLEDIVSLLRYFSEPDSLRAILRAPPEQRGAMWQRFWRATDPNPATPENEAIDEYIARVRGANERFTDEGGQGWLTDRGEVFIVLGEPSDVTDRRQDTIGRGRYIVWNYLDYRLTLTFIDDTGFGRLRLDPRSRAEFQRVRNQVQRH
jgi:GWxTD domain-containing protein